MQDEQRLDELKLTSSNPRQLDQKMSETMDRTIDEYGSLDGIIYNAHPDVQELVGGNQRTIKFKADPSAAIMLTERLETLTGTGTRAYGYVVVQGEKWPYRIVEWPLVKHRKAILAANKVHADFDADALPEFFSELDELGGELDMTGFDEDELSSLPANAEPDFDKQQHDDGQERFTLEELYSRAERWPNESERSVLKNFINALKF